jgi:hypothetical protein
MKVRRSRESDAWHWRPACSFWPSDKVAEEQSILPRGARLCPECAALDLQSALHRLQVKDRLDAAAAARPSQRLAS